MAQYGTGTASASSGGRTLTQLKAICQYHGWDDLGTTGTAQATQFINDTMMMLSTLAPWPEFLHRDGSVTFPKRSVSITSVSAGGGTVTLVTGAHGFAVGDIITITGTDNYDEATVTIAGTSGSTDITYTSSSTGATSTGTVTIDNNVEILSDTRLDRIGILSRTDWAAPLDEITMEDWLLLKKNYAVTGPPTKYALRKYTSTGTPKVEMMVYPDPTTALTMYYTWHSYPSILSSGSDVVEWPDNRVWLLTEALRIRLAAVDRDTTGTMLYGVEFMKNVNRAFAQSRSSFMPIVAKSPYQSSGKPIWGLRETEITITS